MPTQTDHSESSPDQPLEKVLVPFVFPYHATIVRKKHRLPKAEMFLGSDHALIPVVAAPVAYRISFPSTQARYAETKYVANELEIRAHSGSFYWPFEAAAHHAAGARGSLEACRRWLTEKNDILGLLEEAEEYPTISVEDVPVREVIDNDRAAMFKRAIDKIEGNLVACDGRIYQRGGAPAYIQRRPFHLKIGVAAVSPAHRVEAAERGLRRPPGDANFPEVQEMLRWGRIWTPSQHKDAAKAAKNMKATASMPLIRIVDEVAHAGAMSAETARADALYREAMDLASFSPRAWEWICERRAEENPLFLLDETVLDDRQLTKRRLAILSDLHDSLHRENRYYSHDSTRSRLDDLDNEISRFKSHERLMKFADTRLEVETKAEELTEDENGFVSALANF